MTLIVSLRIPDGIVIAGDSLATMTSQMEIKADINFKCPKCGADHAEHVALGGIPLPSSTLSFAQKVFPIFEKYGVGTFGSGQLAGKTMYFAVRELENELLRLPVTSQPSNVTEVAKKIGERAHKLLKQQMVLEAKDISKEKDDWIPLGFQVVGYNGDKATTVELKIGKTVTLTEHQDLGMTFSGQSDVVEAFFDLYKKDPKQEPLGHLFSLQDAITYAEFLISTTATHQAFSRTIPGVGGEIDIALVTPFDDFTWIKQKQLSRILGGKSGEKKKPRK